MFENIMLSFRGIRSHKMRSALTMLGIIIGIAAIIIIVSIINGASAQLKEEMVGDNTNTVTIGLFEKSQEYYMSMEYNTSEQGALVGVNKISDETLEKVLEVDGVESATRFYSPPYTTLKYLDRSSFSNLYGIEPNYFSLSSKVLQSGRLFTERDYEMRNNVAILSDGAANTLFKNENPLGKTIQLGNELFTVVGIVTNVVDYSEIEDFSDYYMSLGVVESSAYVPDTSWNDVQGYDDIQKLMIKIDDADKIATTTTLVSQVLNDDLAVNDYEYKSGTLTEDTEYLKQIMSITSILLIGIASISLLVGGIGVMNIMLVSVTERTREIGLKKALGARRRVILGQFLTESVVLTSIGGLIGVLIGIGIAKLVGIIISMPTVISVGAIAISVGFSMGVGIIFGLVPSIKAANLNPIDALRYE